MATRVEFLDGVCAACFGQYGISQVTQPGYECWTFFLKEWFPAGQLDQRQCLTLLSFLFEGACHVLNRLEDGVEGHGLASFERVRGVAVGTPQVATSQAYENTGKTREGAFTLDAQVNFMDQ